MTVYRSAVLDPDSVGDAAPAIIRDPVRQVRALYGEDERPRYGFASTEAILGEFAVAGWKPVMTKALAARKPERVGFQKHVVRLEHPEYLRLPGLSDENATRPQLVVSNSHDGLSSLRLGWGMFRIVCENGLVAGRSLGDARIIHSRVPIERKLPEAIAEVLRVFPRLIEQASMLQGRTLGEKAVDKAVRILYDARLANVRHLKEVDYVLPRLRRPEDDRGDAYTVLNRLQECLMLGGITYSFDRVCPDADGGIRRMPAIGVSKAIGSVEAQMRLNRLAYDTVMEVAG